MIAPSKKYNCEFCLSDLGFSGDCLINILLLFHPYGWRVCRGCEKMNIAWLGGEGMVPVLHTLLPCIRAAGMHLRKGRGWGAAHGLVGRIHLPDFLISGVPSYIHSDLTSSVA